MRDITEVAREHRARLVAGETRAYAQMRREWRAVQAAVRREVRHIEASLAEAKRRGLPLDTLIERERRLDRLWSLVRAEIDRFAPAAAEVAAGHAEAAATAGAADAASMVRVGLPADFVLDTTRLPTATIERLIATVRSPQWRSLWEARIVESGVTLSKRLGDVLRDGVALGHNPRRIASEMRKVAVISSDQPDPLPLARARTVARTESMRAYRDASIATYEQHPDVVTGWMWIAALDKRTCGSCIAQHGTEHPLSEVMATHPNCRCVAAPVVKPWSRLGYRGIQTPDRPETGISWFRRQGTDGQDAAIGRSMAAAVRSRRITLPDLIARRHDPRWGPSTREASLAEAERNARTRRAAA